MTGPLCDAVTGTAGGKATLEALERGNLFLVPLDDRRHWYRYHRLFEDVLQARLLDERPELVPELHRRACEWHEEHGERSEAIRHAMAGGDVARAANLVELAIPAMSQNEQAATLRRWIEALPDEVIRVRPVLSVGYAGTLMEGGRESRASRPGCGTPNDGWTRQPIRGLEPRRRRWSSPTTMSSAVCRVHVGMSELFRERNDLATASQHLLASHELGEANGLSLRAPALSGRRRPNRA